MTDKEKKLVFGGVLAVVITLFLCMGVCAAVSIAADGSQRQIAVREAEQKSSRKPEKETYETSRETETAQQIQSSTEPAREETAKTTEGEIKADTSLIIETEPSLYTYENMEQDLQNMALIHEIMTVDSLGESMDGRQIYHVLIGSPEASRHVLITGSIHAREYMTTQLVMKQMNEFLKSPEALEAYLGQIAIHVVPMINPDGVSISQFGLNGVRKQETKAYITDVIMKADDSGGGGNYFARWKANAHGVDLNRNFDAMWAQYAGSGHPSSDHFKGEAPGSEPEAAALIRLTESYTFVRTVSYHTQGEVIYWYFGQTGQLKTDTEHFAARISALTGYRLDANYQNLDPAGYKDWAISKKAIPSLTIEVGRNTSPVPPGQFEEIWSRNSQVWDEICKSALGL